MYIIDVSCIFMIFLLELRCRKSQYICNEFVIIFLEALCYEIKFVPGLPLLACEGNEGDDGKSDESVADDELGDGRAGPHTRIVASSDTLASICG